MLPSSERKVIWCVTISCFLVIMLNCAVYINSKNSIPHPSDRTRNGLHESDELKKKGRLESERHTVSADKFVTASTWPGRLGNQLFIYAAVLGTAYKLGVTPFIRKNDPLELRKYIDIKYTGNDNLNNLQMFSEAGCCAYDARVDNLSSATNVSLSGYFQSWKYFEGAENYVRENIKIRQSFLTAAKEFLQKVNTTNRKFIGVHVRRGDKTSQVESKKGNSVAGADYISKAMDYFHKLLDDDITFIVVSDDKQWCSENISGNNTVHSSFDDPGVELAILSLCDHVIITSGTYGWWGAWLAGGRTVFYNGFPRQQSWLAAVMVKEDYYPLRWIGMS